jgi:fucose 4-O-acetylase-like acetyltransferase
MFMMFFISGYFMPISLKTKSSSRFLQSKFKRIIIPWIIAVFTLIPAYKAIFLYSRGLPQEEWFSYFHIFERSGTDLSFFANNPSQNWLWFLPVLFLFQVAYLLLAKTNVFSLKISLKTGVILTFILGVIYSMVISETGLKGWTHSAILDFQSERLLVYFMAFLLGSLCYKLNVFEGNKINYKIYIVSNVSLTISLGIFTVVAINLFYNMIDPGRNHFFISNFVDRLAYYASAILAMLSFTQIFIHAFRFNLNNTNSIVKELGKNSYSVYIIHMIVLGVVALTMLDIPLHGGIKYLLLTTITFLLSNMIVYSWRKARQKTLNYKTVVTVLAVIIITGIAFTSQESKAKETTDKNTVMTSQHSQNMSLHAAVITGNVNAVKHHISSGTDLNEKEPEGGSTALISACVFGKTKIAELLIEAGADIHARNNNGSTALHTAAFFCRTEVIQTLLNHGADPSVKNNAGATPVQTVLGPFTTVKGIYEYFQKVYEPLGLKLDLEQIEKTRPLVAGMLE